VSTIDQTAQPKVGVGLRHAHYESALSRAVDIDFVEVHTENFAMDGGANLAVLERARDLYDVSLHCTALGLGSAVGISDAAVRRLSEITRRFDPMLVSDHLCFCWVDIGGARTHAGDLLPIQRTRDSLEVLACNIDCVQQSIGRPMLVENISVYVDDPGHEKSETEFLCSLVEKTGCRLLVDINNLLVNAHNQGSLAPEEYVSSWLDQIPGDVVGEIHLAGYSPVAPGDIAVDDHGAPVSAAVWRLYEYALGRFGNVPTLIEWDTALPDWSILQNEAMRARHIGSKALGMLE
jgi:uncharacterized protein